MTHTLESLKKILDDGGCLISGEKKLWKKDDCYWFDSGNGSSGTCSNSFTEYALTCVEWSELKTEVSQVAWKEAFTPDNLSDPSMMVVPIDQWNALNKELGELRSANQTLDPAAEYTKPYTFLPLPAAEIMVGIKSGQTWSNGYYTSSGCNEIGIYFDHKFGTTSVPWELVAGFIEENKIWEKKMNDIHQQAEAQLHNLKTKAIGSVTISTESFIDLLYKVHLDGQRRENYRPLASVQHVMEVMRDLPTIVEQDKRKTYDSVKDFFFGTGSGCQAGFCTD